MPRCARVKTEGSIFHIMIRSISEINLFNDDEDKLKYFALIKKYILKFQFKVYAYCLMDNHGHLIIDVNGGDISRIMHSINFSYAQYYNRKYKRHGHVFQDRFKSRIVNDDKYLIVLSAYIHNNPKDIPGYRNNLINYRFSSLKEYVKGTNEFEILDKSFLEDILNLANRKNMKTYLSLVYKSDTINEELDVEFEKKNCEYRSERKILARDYTPEKVIKFIADYIQCDKRKARIKYDKSCIEIRALCVFFMRCFCNYTQKQICSVIGNLTQSRVSKLSSIGIDIILNTEKYSSIIDDFIKSA
ncbi:transposase [Crassaminicella thermophila]|uniref:Transposase n=1 Tax=Crassaminicella thermophila TaxID=2599308 RepID=A0A5C0SEL8_CRATE|nr:transposase [Crassaminicella thermophila]QEK13075.1 transposase [Crassaminicella thermophila]